MAYYQNVLGVRQPVCSRGLELELVAQHMLGVPCPLDTQVNECQAVLKTWDCSTLVTSKAGKCRSHQGEMGNGVCCRSAALQTEA